MARPASPEGDDNILAHRRGPMAVAGRWIRLVEPRRPFGGCLTVRAVWKDRLVLNQAGTGVTGVMDPGLGSVRPIGRVKGSESTVRIPRGIEAVRLPDRL